MLHSKKSIVNHTTVEDSLKVQSYLKYLEGKDHRTFIRLVILPKVTGSHVLDIGCATGVLFEELLRLRTENTYQLTGIEKISKLARIAQQKELPKTTIVEKNVTTYPYPKTQYDSIIMTSVAHEIISNYSVAIFSTLIKKLYLALKPHGRLILFDGFKNDDLIAVLTIKNPYKQALFEQFMKIRSQYHFFRKGTSITTSVTAAFDFLHKCYYAENWQRELKEVYYPLSHESYATALYAAGFKHIQCKTFPETENIEKIRQEFSLTDLAGNNLLSTHCNCLLVAQKIS